jgi:hypothetical protein
MSLLNALKLTAAQKPTHLHPVQQRRNKMAKRLWEQIELAKAQQAGTTFMPTKLRLVKDAETGVRKSVEAQKRVKAWWFTGENGKLVLSLRYGSRVLELAKGKAAVEVAASKDLVPTLETLKAAVLAGELDAQIESAAGKLREGFAS